MAQVAYHDYEHFSQTGELIEAVVDRYYSMDKPTADGRSGFGFAKTADGKSYFFHINNGHRMCPRGTGKLDFIPEFRDEWRPGEVFGDPIPGKKIVGVIGPGRKDKVCIVEWSYPEEYEKALALCEIYREFVLERVERNPNFRCMEIRRDPVGLEDRRTNPVFEGTKEQFEKRYPLGYFTEMGNPDPLLSRRIGDMEYIRWFERETLDGWERCGDPRKIHLPLTRAQAQRLLRFECVRTVDEEGLPVWTSKDSTRFVAMVTFDHPKGEVGIIFDGTGDHLETVFRGKAMDDLWNIGAPDEFEAPKPTTIPDSRQYEQLNRRGRDHMAHDLAQLGRSASEWEELSGRFKDK